jgi:hypothetical protein
LPKNNQIERTYTLLAQVDITFTKTNPWDKRKLITAILKGAVEKAFVEAVKVDVAIPEMQHGKMEAQ